MVIHIRLHIPHTVLGRPLKRDTYGVFARLAFTGVSSVSGVVDGVPANHSLAPRPGGDDVCGCLRASFLNPGEHVQRVVRCALQHALHQQQHF